MKSEGDSYSIDHLARDLVTPWEGVRNYQSRNFMVQDMQVDDLVLFYHSNAKPSGVYGVAKVVTLAHPDESQFDTSQVYFAQKASRVRPIWFCVDVGFVEKFNIPIGLEQLKSDPNLEGMLVRAKGSRLSIQPVSQEHFSYICHLARVSVEASCVSDREVIG